MPVNFFWRKREKPYAVGDHRTGQITLIYNRCYLYEFKPEIKHIN